METGRLRSVLEAGIADLESAAGLTILKALVTAYSASVQNPNLQNAAAFSSAREKLRGHCTVSYCDTLSGSRRRILHQLDIEDILGGGLGATVDRILATPTSPAEIATLLQSLLQKATTFVEIAKSAVAALDKLGVAPEEVAPGEAEVEVAIPTSLLPGGMEELGKEVRALSRAIADIVEMGAGVRPNLKVSGAGSGSVEIYLALDPCSGVVIVQAVTAILSLITAIITIRKTRVQVASAEAPKSLVDAFKDWERELVGSKLKELAAEIQKKSPLDKGRKEELEKGLADSIKRLADRIDRGVDIDVVTQPEDGEPSEAADAEEVRPSAGDAVQRILVGSQQIRAFVRPAEPVLALPVPKDDSGVDAAVPAKEAAAKAKK